MKYFYIRVTTQYDGLEWTSEAVTRGHSQETVQRKANRFDFTHDNGIEVQEVHEVREIPFSHFLILSEYMITI